LIDPPQVDLAVLICGPLDVGLSGGDMHALRLCDRVVESGRSRVRVLAPASFEDRLSPAVRPHLQAVRTPLDGRVTSMPAYLILVLWRTLVVLRRLPRARVAVASTHFFFDVVPAAMMRRRHGTRVAAYVYHLIGESGRTGGVRNWASALTESMSLALLRRTANVIFVDNEETMRALRSRGFRAEQLTMTQNAYDPLGALPPPIPAERPTVVFVGRLVEVKGVWVMLDLARELRARLPAATVTIIGDGPLRSELEQALGSEGAANVELVGFVSEAEKWRRLRSATLFASPSREEGWGIAVGEALTAGIPAVVYDLPAYRHFGELVERVPVGDAASYVRTVTDLLCDSSRLELAVRRLTQGPVALPTWDTVLAGELAHLEI
jgi:glycosyltransferase involved in cell wall biosynthesis